MLKSFHFLVLTMGLLLFSCEGDKIQPSPTTLNPEQQLQKKVQQFEAELERELAEMETEGAIGLRSQIVLPAGSIDGLAAAIEEAGPGGTVLLESGPHVETGTVNIDHRIRLIGEDNATLIFDSAPLEVAGNIEVGLHFLDANRSVVRNIDFRVAGAVGGTAILLQNSHRTMVTRSSMEDFQFGVLIERSDRVFITHNDIAVSDLWQVGAPIVQSFGIVAINGRDARVYANRLSGGVTGIWACDKNGYIARNEFFGNLQGIILCRVPAEYNYRLPDGYLLAADLSCTNWAVFLNESHDNLDYGYQVIDGANNNFLLANTARDNLSGAYEFAGDTERFGLGITPTSFENTALIFSNDAYLDCGADNIIIGGSALDNTSGNCF
ncbi:MAG: right-handed parallel beta-helix repeat-containing protein [Lewinella sp.]